MENDDLLESFPRNILVINSSSGFSESKESLTGPPKSHFADSLSNVVGVHVKCNESLLPSI